MKIAFFGTPQFAADILSGVLGYEDLEVSLVVSQPDRPVGRKKEFLPTPVKQIAMNNSISILQPEKIRKNKDFSTSLIDLDLDFIVVVAYGKIIPQSILDIPKYGCINIHGSILPLYRGASPVQSAIKDGHTETGLTTMYMSKKMDEGDILQTQNVEILPDDTSPKIFEKFVDIGPSLLVDTLKKVVSGDLQGAPQNHRNATYCHMISREDGQVSFQEKTAQDIYNIYRAYQPWPGIYTWYEGYRLVLEEVKYSSQKAPSHTAGRVIKIGKSICVVCNDELCIELKKVKLEGKRSMDILSFLNGNTEFLGGFLE